jgi:hypothetical protein
MVQQTACWLAPAVGATGDRRISRSPSFAAISRVILNWPSDVDEGATGLPAVGAGFETTRRQAARSA